ncbi:MAG TPA: helix-turn-helix domain-containing protein [Puia sp.]|nr:helix-turn-helix domain-containing protein [Puia sp.]
MKQEVTITLPVKKRRINMDDHKCSVITTLKIFAAKWKPCILCYLGEHPMRYNELYRMVPNISRKMLSDHLKEMEKDELIIRKQFDRKRQRVEYDLSDKGRSLLRILEDIQHWGLKNLPGVLSIKEMICLST